MYVNLFLKLKNLNYFLLVKVQRIKLQHLLERQATLDAEVDKLWAAFSEEEKNEFVEEQREVYLRSTRKKYPFGFKSWWCGCF